MASKKAFIQEIGDLIDNEDIQLFKKLLNILRK